MPLPYTHTHQFNRLGLLRLFEEKGLTSQKEQWRDTRRWRQKKGRRRRRWFSSIRAEIDEMWQVATLLISMTQLSQPYFRKIKRPYGKLACLKEGGRGWRSEGYVYVCVKMNKLVVCRWPFCFSPPPICSPPLSTILSFWHGNGSKLMKTLHSFSDNSTGKRHKHFLHASSSITHKAPPFCPLGIGWAGSCLIS